MRQGSLLNNDRTTETFPPLTGLIDITRKRQRIVALDPGGTIGYSTYAPPLGTQEPQITQGQYKLKEFTDIRVWLHNLIDAVHPSVIVCESYHIYPHKLQEHTNSDVPTLQLIGAIRIIAADRGLPVVFQTAAQGKAFVTDLKLRAWNLYQKGQPHANDATRHLLRYLIFPRTRP